MTLQEFLKKIVEKGASDMHIKVSRPPLMRLRGDLVPFENVPPLTNDDVRALIQSITTPEQQKKLQAEKELDFSFYVDGLARFRGNVFHQRGLLSAVFRIIPTQIPTVQQSTLFRLAMRGARTYTVIFKDARSEILTIPDPFLMRHFSSCPIGDSAPTKDLVLCLTKNTLRLPVFFLKKAIGLFDHFHWNTYATYVTPTWMIVMQRIIGSLGFSGFLGIPFVVGYAMHKKRRVTQVLVILVFPLLSFAMTSVIAIESRYGMAVMPFGMISAVLIGQWILKRRDKKAMLVAGLLSLLILTFLLQTLQWDLLDAFPRIPLILAT